MFEAQGGKRAVLARCVEPLRIALGGHARFVDRRLDPVDRLVFVCAGNICRSPFGEYLARRLGIPTFSMGLRATQGAPPNPQAVRHAAQRGVDMAGHAASELDPSRVGAGDLVLGFERWHVLELEAALAGRGAQIRLLGGFLGPAGFHIHDPYGLSDAYFERCFRTIDTAVTAAARALRSPVRP